MLIQDIKPAPEQPPRSAYEEAAAAGLSTEAMLTELFKRGVTIEEVFGHFYQLEAMADAHADKVFGNDEDGQHGRQPLTIGDALLAGVMNRNPGTF